MSRLNRTDAPTAPLRPNRRVSAGLRDRLGENLRTLRRARGISQIELAALCGCRHEFISKLENSRINATLEMLARAHECCESDLLRRGLPPPRGPPPPEQAVRAGMGPTFARSPETDADPHPGR